MLCNAGITPDGVTRWPIHRHTHPEAMCYLEGEGYLFTPERKIPFRRGTIIFVPAGIAHGSQSENGFKNISIAADFPELSLLRAPIVLPADENSDAFLLSSMIMRNQHIHDACLLSLLSAFAHCIRRHTDCDFTGSAASAVRRICEAMTTQFSDAALDTHALLLQSGYAPDYIRALFKRHTGKTPVQFLMQLRLAHAVRLLDIYGASLSVATLAQQCGFADSVYFSHAFKAFTGHSPRAYAHQKALNNTSLL